MKQKRQTTGMIQASDIRNASAKSRATSAHRKELHGRYPVAWVLMFACWIAFDFDQCCII